MKILLSIVSYLCGNIYCYKNYVKFFKQFNIVPYKKITYTNSVFEYDDFLWHKLKIDHSKTFKDVDNNFVMTTSPYTKHNFRHSKYDFFPFDNLYNNATFTYVKVISLKQINENLKLQKQMERNQIIM